MRVKNKRGTILESTDPLVIAGWQQAGFEEIREEKPKETEEKPKRRRKPKE